MTEVGSVVRMHISDIGARRWVAQVVECVIGDASAEYSVKLQRPQRDKTETLI